MESWGKHNVEIQDYQRVAQKAMRALGEIGNLINAFEENITNRSNSGSRERKGRNNECLQRRASMAPTEAREKTLMDQIEPIDEASNRRLPKKS